MHRDNKCMYIAHVCFYVCCIDCVGSVGMFVGKDSVFSLGVVKYAVCLCRGCDGCSVFCCKCGAWNS